MTKFSTIKKEAAPIFDTAPFSISFSDFLNK